MTETETEPETDTEIEPDSGIVSEAATGTWDDHGGGGTGGRRQEARGRGAAGQAGACR